MPATKRLFSRGISGALAAIGVLFPALVAAQEPARQGRVSALSWVRLPGAEACIAAPALASAVEARLGRRVFVPPSDAEITVEGTIAQRPDKKSFHASFRVTDRAGKVLGSREVDEAAPSCDKLDDKLAFVLSLLIDPERAMSGPEPPAPPPGRDSSLASGSLVDPALTTPLPPNAQPPAPERPKETPPPPDDDWRSKWRWMVGADFGGAAGLVPDVGWVVGGSVLVTPPHWPGLRARLASYLPSSRRVEGAAIAEIGLVSGEVGLCPLELRPAPFGFTVCVSGLVGQLDARGSGFPESRGYSTTVGGLALDVVAELVFTKWFVMTLSPTLLVPVSRARLSYDDAAGARHAIFEVAPVGGALALGLAFGSRP